MGEQSINKPIAFKSDFSKLSGTVEDKLTSLVALQTKLIEEHNAEGYKCNRWYQHWRPRFQAVGREIVGLRKQLSEDSPSLSDDGEGGKIYYRHAEKTKEGFDSLKKSIAITEYFTGENPTKELPDPYEDFSGYTEVDPEGNFAIGNGSSTDTKITVTDLDQNTVAYIYKDFTADHFEDFTHALTAKLTSYTGNPRSIFWAVSNVLADYSDWNADNDEAIAAFFYYDTGTSTLQLRMKNTEIPDVDMGSVSISTSYYITIDRDGDTINLYIRTGSHSGTLVDTLSVSVGSAKKYRYMMPVVSIDWWQSGVYSSYEVQDLDLQEVIHNSIFFGMNF